jgi:NitT/TauT family transport system ATP-binding protein
VATRSPVAASSGAAAGAAIDIANIAKRYAGLDGEVEALRAVSLGVGEGEFVSVLGPSGCGKSTLMLLVAGLEPASSGAIHIAGRKVDRPYTDLGIVFQDHALLDWRSVMGNVMLQIEMRKLPPERFRARATELIARVGLDGFADKYPFELSGGMRQRAAICRALVHDPPVLFFDEPFGALDALTREQMRIDLEKLWLERRQTVLFITHSIQEAVLLSDRVVVMTPRPGRVDRIVTVDLPRPRDQTVQRSPEFARYCEEITQCFMAHGVIKY